MAIDNNSGFQSLQQIKAGINSNFSLAETVARLANNPTLERNGVYLTTADVNAVWEASMETSQGQLSRQYTPFNAFEPIPSSDQLKSVDDLEKKADERWKTSGVNYLNRDNVLDTVWDYLSVPLNIVTSTLITAGTFGQDLRTLNFGKNFNADNIAEAWDWTDDNHIDFGTAAMYFVGNAGPLGMAIAGAENLLMSEADKKKFNEFTTSWGVNAFNTNYNIFDEEQRAASEGAQGLNIGSVFTQGLNFVGELVIDPINLVPFGKLGRLLAGSSKIVSGAGVASKSKGYTKAVNQVVDILEGGAENVGQAVASKNGLALQLQGVVKQGDKFAKDGKRQVSATYVRETVFKGAKGDEADRASLLMARIANDADTEEEAIWLMTNALAAIEMGSTRALVNIANKYADNAVLIKALDDMNPNGSFLERISYRKAVFDPEDFADDPELYKQAQKYARLLDNVRKQEFAENGVMKNLLGLSDQLVGDEIVSGAGFIRQYSAMDGRITGAIGRNVEGARATFQAWKLGDLADGSIQYSLPTIGGRWYHIISRPARIAQQKVGLKNEFDILEGDFDRVASWALGADKVLRGALKKSGEYDEFITAYRTAITPAARKEVVEQFETKIIGRIAEQNNITASAAKGIASELMSNRNKYRKQMQQRGYSLQSDGSMIIDERMKVSKTEALPAQVEEDPKIVAWDWETLDTIIKNDASPARKAIYDSVETTKDVLRFVQRNWSSLLLLKPNRSTRETIQNFPTALLSGALFEGWADGNIGKAFKNVLENTNLIRGQVSHGIKTITGYDASLKEIDKSIESIDDDINSVDEGVKDIMQRIQTILSKPLNEMTSDEIQLLNEVIDINNNTKLSHVANGGLPTRVVKGKLISSFDNTVDAEIYQSKFGTPLNLNEMNDVISLQIASGNGMMVQRKGPNGEWETLEPKVIDAELEKLLKKDAPTDGKTRRKKSILENAELRLLDPNQLPKIEDFDVYGREINLSDWTQVQKAGLANALKIRSPKEFGTFMKNRKWEDPEVQKVIVKWAEKNGYGKLNIADTSSPNGRTILAVPKYAAIGDNATDAAKAAYDDIYGRLEVDEITLDDILAPKTRSGRKEAMVEARAGVNETVTANTPAALNELADPTQLVNRLAQLKATRKRLETIRRQLEVSARKVQKYRNISDRVAESSFGSAKFQVRDADGNLIDTEVAGLFEGPQGRVTAANITTGIGAEARITPFGVKARKSNVTVGTIEPNDTRYFEGQANVINNHFRNKEGKIDSITLMLIKGKSAAYIVKWLKSTPEGQAYFRELSGLKHNGREINAFSAEEYIDSRVLSHNAIFFDKRIEDEFLKNNEISKEWLAENFADYPDKPIIVGSLSDPVEYQNFAERAGAFIGALQQILSDIPTRNLYAKPIAHTVYKRSMQARIQTFIDNNGRMPSPNEQLAMTKRAHKDALTETRKYVYNAGNSSNATEFLRWAMPFVTAQTFVAKSFAAGSFNNPAATVWLVYSFNKALRSQQWVDENGNPVDNPQDAVGLVFQIEERLAKSMENVPILGDYFKYGREIVVSKNSLDPIFAGNYIPIGDGELQIPNPFSPGFGPLVSMPISELVKANFDSPFWNWVASGKEGSIWQGVLPFGASNVAGSLDMLEPGDLFERFFNKREWLQLQAQVMAYENGRLATGDRAEPPTAEEIRDTTNRIYDMRFNTNFFTLVPFRRSIKTEFDVAKRLLYRYREAYGQREGELRFMVEHPDLVYATESGSENKFDVDYTVNQVKQLRDNEELVNEIAVYGDAGVDMLQFLFDPDENYEFSQPAYAWLTSKGYVQPASAEEIRQRVLAKYGWASFRRGMDQLDSLAVKKGTSIEQDDELKAMRRALIKKIENNTQYGAAWAKEYRSIDPSRRETFIQVFDDAMRNKKWAAANASRPDIRAISAFFDLRTKVKNTLMAKYFSGQPYTLNDNPTTKQFYEASIANLKKENIIFADFYNRYFEGDRVIS
jgi:hypothetical protein